MSAAEIVAAGITHPSLKASPHVHGTPLGVPPPECPMHQNVAKPAASDCPAGFTDDKSDINPYNMVCANKFLLLLSTYNREIILDLYSLIVFKNVTSKMQASVLLLNLPTRLAKKI